MAAATAHPLPVTQAGARDDCLGSFPFVPTQTQSLCRALGLIMLRTCVSPEFRGSALPPSQSTLHAVTRHTLTPHHRLTNPSGLCHPQEEAQLPCCGLGAPFLARLPAPAALPRPAQGFSSADHVPPRQRPWSGPFLLESSCREKSGVRPPTSPPPRRPGLSCMATAHQGKQVKSGCRQSQREASRSQNASYRWMPMANVLIKTPSPNEVGHGNDQTQFRCDLSSLS